MASNRVRHHASARTLERVIAPNRTDLVTNLCFPLRFGPMLIGLGF